jgi:hypothetical protein
MKIDILENLRHLAAAPGVGFDEVRLGQCGMNLFWGPGDHNRRVP